MNQEKPDLSEISRPEWLKSLSVGDKVFVIRVGCDGGSLDFRVSCRIDKVITTDNNTVNLLGGIQIQKADGLINEAILGERMVKTRVLPISNEVLQLVFELQKNLLSAQNSYMELIILKLIKKLDDFSILRYTVK